MSMMDSELGFVQSVIGVAYPMGNLVREREMEDAG